MCRSGSLKLPGFPNFESVVSELKTSTAESPTPAFEVCIPVPNGLAIKQNLVDYWSGMDAYQLQVADMVKAHNQKYNPHGTKRGASDMSQGDQGTAGKAVAKKICIDNTVKVADHEASIADKLTLPCGNFRLVYDIQQDKLWLCGNEAKKRESFEVKGPIELFGFGSSDFVEGPEAQDVQSDLTGRWISFKVNQASELCVLEPDRRLPQHIRSLDIWNKVQWYSLVKLSLYLCVFLAVKEV
ncbi:unnamed protein product [Durusdinium trenchii]|uniref:Uncharacterized protein n=1 Tax=Durusdinium trenchii TaxID=1381693 RepID=A0ABP0SAS4_9DINO